VKPVQAKENGLAEARKSEKQDRTSWATLYRLGLSRGIQMSFETYKVQLAKLEEEAANLRAKIASYENLDPDQQLAETLHARLCRWNHTDGCSWGYETWQELGSTKKDWLDKARRLQAFLKDNNIKEKDILYFVECLCDILNI
jgi:hypothetical protein